MKLDVESIDLEKLAESVHARAGGSVAGNLTGRSAMRDIVAEHLVCSLLEAEELVDTLIARGFVRMEFDGEGAAYWRFARGT